MLVSVLYAIVGAGVDMSWAVRLRNGFHWHPKAILDVGANVGLWTTTARRVFPNASFHMVEANPALRKRLEQVGGSSVPVTISILGNETRPVTFYMARKGAFHADKGSSLFVEQTNRNNFEALTVQQQSLDDLFAQREGPPFELLKVDAQGAELLILEGARRLLTTVEVRKIAAAPAGAIDSLPLDVTMSSSHCSLR